MKTGKKQTIAIDVDDVLFPCISDVIKLARKRGVDVRYEDVIKHDFANFAKDEIALFFSIMGKPDFYQRQMPYNGAREMIDELIEAGHEVVIASAVPPTMMGFRSELLLRFFPNLKPRNIMLGARKDLLHVDFLLDDAMHNITATPAKYPVVMDRPWNASEEGYLRVSGYDEFIRMVEAVSLAPSGADVPAHKNGRPGIICLVGPSASGKSYICDELVRNPTFKRVQSVTTRAPRDNDAPGEYEYIDREVFITMKDTNALVEHTLYAGEYYGISKKAVSDVWKSGYVAVRPVDFNGAKACKDIFGERCMTVFVRRNKADVITAILERGISNAEKTRRLLTLDREYENEAFCDWTVSNNGSIEHAVEQILRVIN